MSLSKKQLGVLRGMVAAAAVAVVGLTMAVFGPLRGPDENVALVHRLRMAMICDTFVLLPLALSIAALARYRFFSPADIDGSGLSEGTDEAVLLQAILQNTLEQTVLAVGAHLGWAAAMPSSAIGAVPVAATMFLVGRAAFAFGYRHGARSRAFGFALTFYPTLIMLVWTAIHVVATGGR